MQMRWGRAKTARGGAMLALALLVSLYVFHVDGLQVQADLTSDLHLKAKRYRLG